jgi:hypothetical protein
MKTAIAIIACLTCCSCAVFRSQSDWTDRWPTEPTSPWQRTVDVAFSNAPLPRVIAELEATANAEDGPRLSLALGQIRSGPWDESPHPTITFTATGITVVEAFLIVGDITNHRAMFRGLDGILAEHYHGHGEMTVFLTGRCVDAATGRPIETLSVSRNFDEIKPKTSGEFLHPFRVEGTTEFVWCDGKNYLMKTEPLPQDIRVVVTAPGYQPQEMVLSLQDSELTYTNNIEMKRDIPTPNSSVRGIPRR